ncbi:MAG: ArnT family glycosyltransferase [Armatimonadota bacterium]
MCHPLLALITFIPILIISIAFGRKILNLMRVDLDSSLESSVFGLATGFGIMSYAIFTIGVLGLLYAWSILAVVILMGILAYKDIGLLLKEILDVGRNLVRNSTGAAGILIRLGMLIVAAFAIIPALAPPSGLDWDGLAYHLAIPKIYLQNHSIKYVPFISHSNFPFLTEMLYTLGLAFKSTGVAKLFHYVMYIGTAVAIYAICVKHANALTGRIAAILFLTVPVVAWEAGIAYTDLSTALYITLAVYALLNWEKTDKSNWLVVCGIMCGFAFGTKVLAAIPIFTLCVWILITKIRSKQSVDGLKLGLMVGCIALIIGAPWYIKSYIYTGNPFYPFLYNVFGGKYWSQGAADAYRGSQLAFGMGRGITQLLMAPWNLFANGVYFFDIPNPKNPAIWGVIGPVFMGLIPLSFYTIWNERLIRKIAAFIFLFVITWFFMMQYSRYLITIIPMMCIIVGYVVSEVNLRTMKSRHAVNVFVAVCVFLSIFNGYRISVDSLKSAVGLESADTYLSRTLDVYDAENWINTNLPDDAGIALFDEVRGFYLDRKYIWANPGHHEMITWNSFTNSNDMVKFLEDMGYQYALVNVKFANQDALHFRLIREAVRKGEMRELYTSKGVTVFRFEKS